MTARITLSMFTADSLPADLRVIKKATGIPLVKFEEAKVELGKPYYNSIKHGTYQTDILPLTSTVLHNILH